GSAACCMFFWTQSATASGDGLPAAHSTMRAHTPRTSRSVLAAVAGGGSFTVAADGMVLAPTPGGAHAKGCGAGRVSLRTAMATAPIAITTPTSPDREDEAMRRRYHPKVLKIGAANL